MLTPQWIAKATDGKLVRAQPVAVSGFSTDTRTIRPHQVFIALPGATHDGHQFLDEAFQKGASAAVISDATLAHLKSHANLVLVANTQDSLYRMAQAYRSLFQTSLIGITGSVGKTTTKELLGRLLQTRFKSYHSPGNWNNEIGLPLSMLNMPFGTQIGVFELATQRPGELQPLAELVNPSVGVITTVTDAHSGNFSSVEELVNEKWSLINALPLAGGMVVLNADTPLLWSRATHMRFRVDFAIERAGVAYRAEDIAWHDLDGMSFTLVHPSGSTRLHSKLLGTHNIYNILAACAVAMEMRVDAHAVQQVVADFAPFPHRLECTPSQLGIIVDDCYNASPTAVKAAVAAISQLNSAKRKVFVFGDMLELGERAVDYHQEVGDWVHASNIQQVFTLGQLAAVTARTLQKQHGWSPHDAQAAQSLDELETCMKRTLSDENNLILVKGSRSMALDQLVDHLKQPQK